MKQLILVFFLSLSAAHAETIHFVTEEYPPYNFSTDKGVSGASVDQVALIMKAINLPYEIEVLPLARAFAFAESEPFHCVSRPATTPSGTRSSSGSSRFSSTT